MVDGFAKVPELDHAFAHKMARPSATTQYVMYFIPRSGS